MTTTRRRALVLIAVVGLVAGATGACSSAGLPAPTITSGPAASSASTTAAFAFSGPGGATFQCGLDGSAYASCTSPKTYTGLAQGLHAFAVRAIKGADRSDSTSYRWRVDTVAPGAPTITQQPTDRTANATNTVAWTGAEPGLTSQCALENGAWFRCSSPYTWVIDTTNDGQHQFAVRSIDAAGNVSARTSSSFTYEKGLPTSGTPFQVTGGVTGLIIGVWRPVAVTITNPNPVTIVVSQLTVSFSADSTPSGCASATNIELQPTNISGAQTVSVPPKGTVTLPAQGATAPQVRLKNLPTVNQDVCKNATFGLTFSGTANN